MKKYKVIKLKNLSPVHIGTGRESYDVSAGELHSDTLSAALAATGVSIGLCEDVQSFLSLIRISSAFPYWGDSYFLPKPQGRLNVTIKGQQEHEYRKLLKKIKYVDSSLWQTLAAGDSLQVEDCQVKGSFLVQPSAADMKGISKSQVSQRISVCRDGERDSYPFYFEWQYYAPQAGLYCLLDVDENMVEAVKQMFVALGEIGIGTDKSVGGGKFDVEVSEMEIAEPNDADSTMMLSLYVPTEDEFEGLLDGNTKYTILRRGGYMAGSSVERFRHLWKKTVYAFGVGSTFHTTKRLEGKVVDIRPAWNDDAMHPVYRSGKALAIRIKTNNGL